LRGKEKESKNKRKKEKDRETERELLRFVKVCLPQENCYRSNWGFMVALMKW